MFLLLVQWHGIKDKQITSALKDNLSVLWKRIHLQRGFINSVLNMVIMITHLLDLCFKNIKDFIKLTTC